MFWMIHEALGIGNLFDFSGLTNGDAAARADADEFAAMIFDLEWLMISSLLLVVSCEIHWINGSSVSRVSMFITIIFYVLSFFNVSMVTSLLFTSLGKASAEASRESDARAPSVTELVIETPQIAQYHGSNGIRVTNSVTNATEEYWETMTVKTTVLAADGTACMDFEREERWVAPGEQRKLISGFLDPAVYFSDPNCVPASATTVAVEVDVDSRTEIDLSQYVADGKHMAYTALTLQEVAAVHG